MDWTKYKNLLLYAECLKKQKEQSCMKILDLIIYVLLFGVVVAFFFRPAI